MSLYVQNKKPEIIARMPDTDRMNWRTRRKGIDRVGRQMWHSEPDRVKEEFFRIVDQPEQRPLGSGPQGQPQEVSEGMTASSESGVSQGSQVSRR